MRSSKNRSRSKGNRNRSVGNIVNRVFDSSGPEGKVRGTPQQIIDKYNQLARDAQLSNDRVAAENFQQHAEHYTRLLSEAQREMEARREQQEQHNNQRRERHAERDQQQPRDPGAGEQPRIDPPSEAQPEAGNAFDDVIDNAPAQAEPKADIVETPEEAPKPRRGRRRKAPAEDQPAPEAAAGETPEGTSEAAE